MLGIACRLHPFVRRAGLWFLAGAALIAVAVTAFLWRSNEIASFGGAIRAEGKVLWGPAFSQFDFEYKRRRAVLLKPEILALGSSRANQFRAAMFPGARFYSAAGAANNLEKAERFLRDLYARHKPQVLILTFDPWWLRPQENANAAVEDFAPEDFSVSKLLATALRHMADPRFMLSIIKENRVGKGDPFSGRPAIGYRAAWFGEGYREDGSVQYGRVLLGTDRDYDLYGYGYRNGFKYYTRALQQRTGRFRYTGPIVASRLARLDAILDLNRRNGIATIVVLPPYPHAIYKVIQNSAEQRDYFARVEAAVEAVARRHGAEFHNFHDLAVLGVDDRQTIDDIHADEFAYLTMVVRIAHASAALKGRVDVAAMEALLGRSRDPANRPNLHLIAH